MHNLLTIYKHLLIFNMSSLSVFTSHDILVLITDYSCKTIHTQHIHVGIKSDTTFIYYNINLTRFTKRLKITFTKLHFKHGLCWK